MVGHDKRNTCPEVSGAGPSTSEVGELPDEPIEAVHGAVIKLRDAVPGIMDIQFNSSEINNVSYFHLITIKYP